MIEGVPMIRRINILLAKETDGETCIFRLVITGIFASSNATNLLVINYFTCFS